jgi:hypothetical protein
MKMIFSVGPIKGKKSVKGCAGLNYVSRNEIAFEGKVRVVAYACEEGSKNYRGPVLENPTWGKLFSESKKAAKRTKDYHYFFEGFYIPKFVGPLPEGAPVEIRLSMGS